MNRLRRKAINRANELVNEAYDLIDIATVEEEDALTNTPENILGSAKIEKMEEYVDRLTEAREQLEIAKEAINQILD